ncbi:MAG: family 43 glycosylhydrolase [Deinococcota bacterium]
MHNNVLHQLLWIFGGLLGIDSAQTYTNPVVTPVAADPSIIRAADGTFYLYATQDNWDDGMRSRYLPIFTSDDLVTWTYLKDIFFVPPNWKARGGFLWAPDISYYDETYYLYYAYSLWGDPNPCIGLATAAHPEGPWEDLGRAVFCSQDIGVANSIDPFVWTEDDMRTLIWGSFHGIYAVTLSEDGTRPVGDKVLIADDRFEGAYVSYRDGFYTLFVSAGSCCEGADSTYTLYVGRAEQLTGPYLDSTGRDLRQGGGDVILAANEAWVGAGHNALVTDDEGTDWLLYHAIPRQDPRLDNGVNRRLALLERLEWQDGWPIINDGSGPSSTSQPAPVINQ